MRRFVDSQGALFAIRPLILVGLLSFPAYVGHATVIPLKDVLMELGAPYPAALGLALGLFLIAAFYAISRLKRIYYPANASKTEATG